jgi:hypothetical protein
MAQATAPIPDSAQAAVAECPLHVSFWVERKCFNRDQFDASDRPKAEQDLSASKLDTRSPRTEDHPLGRGW